MTETELRTRQMIYDDQGHVREGVIVVKLVRKCGPYGYRVKYIRGLIGEGHHEWEYLGLAQPGISIGTYPPDTSLSFIRGHASEATKRTWNDPKIRTKRIEAMNTPEVKVKVTGANSPMKRPEVRAKITGKNSSQWKGGTSFLPYCPKFNESRKELVRNDYQRLCANCGRTELLELHRLSVHHVDGDKMQGCKDSQWFGLDGRWFLVPLCHSCHGKGLERDLYSVGAFWLAELSRVYWQRRMIFQ